MRVNAMKYRGKVLSFGDRRMRLSDAPRTLTVWVLTEALVFKPRGWASSLFHTPCSHYTLSPPQILSLIYSKKIKNKPPNCYCFWQF